MTRLAVTGHQALPLATRLLVDAAVRTEIDRHHADDLIGLSCLAEGAEELFAQAILDTGGRLIAIVPARRYRDGLSARYRPTYDALLDQACAVSKLDIGRPCPEAFMAAGARMVNEADILLAVFDGSPPCDTASAADVVAYANERGVQVVRIWPPGATRQ